MNELFRKFSARMSNLVGSPWAFLIALLVIIAWAVTGPIFHFSDTWQLVINTGTTVVTFLMVFLIQNTQNRDAKALHLKLDELIRTNVKARNSMFDLENLSDEELQRLQEEFQRIRNRHNELAQSVEDKVDAIEDKVESIEDELEETQSKENTLDSDPRDLGTQGIGMK